MKQNYVTPLVEVHELMLEESILTGSKLETEDLKHGSSVGDRF